MTELRDSADDRIKKIEQALAKSNVNFDNEAIEAIRQAAAEFITPRVDSADKWQVVVAEVIRLKGIPSYYNPNEEFYRTMPDQHVDSIYSALQRSGHTLNDEVRKIIDRALLDYMLETSNSRDWYEHPGRKHWD